MFVTSLWTTSLNMIVLCLGLVINNPPYLEGMQTTLLNSLAPKAVLANYVDGEISNESFFSNIDELTRNPDKTFLDLPITDSERMTIHKIIRTMATHNVVKLLWKKKDLERMGRTINHVHPLRFLWSILSDPKLHNDLHVIRGDFFKWNGFLDGVRRRMTEEFFNNNISAYVPGFCEELHLSEEVMNHHIAKRDWEGLVKAAM